MPHDLDDDLGDVSPELRDLIVQLARTPDVDADAAEILAEVARIERGLPGSPATGPVAALARRLARR